MNIIILKKPKKKVNKVEIEADDEEIKLRAEILENWNTPNPIPSEMLPQNPFSHFDVDEIYTKSKHNEIIPVLIADTFYDKLLRHAADGIDIAAMVGPTNVSPNQPNEIDKPHLSSCFKKQKQIDRRCYEFPHYWQYANTSGEKRHTEISICSQLDFVRKLGAMLYSNKTINTDEFGEKMWRNPGADTADFFNYGLDEKQWESYCKQMHALIHEPCPQSTTTNDNTLEDGEIAQDDSIHEIEIRRLNTTNRNGGAKLVSNNRNKQHLNPTAINR